MYLHGTIEELLSRTSQRWRWLRFLRLSIVLATVAAGLVLLLGLGMACGLVATEAAATAWSVLFAVTAILAWMVIAFSCAVAEENRSLLAASIEHAHAPLMDRLNTLVYLQQQGKHPPHPYAEPIERQARNVIAQAPPGTSGCGRFRPRRFLRVWACWRRWWC